METVTVAERIQETVLLMGIRRRRSAAVGVAVGAAAASFPSVSGAPPTITPRIRKNAVTAVSASTREGIEPLRAVWGGASGGMR